MKEFINVFDYANVITSSIGKGILLTSKADGRVNTMTIGWGTLGVEWSKPVFACYVREGRATRPMIDASGEFTISIPYGSDVSEILRYCGTHSGRDVDKVKACGLTLEDPETLLTPGVRELPLTLECRVAHRQKQELETIDRVFRERFYPQDVESRATGANRDAHIQFYGEIVCAYLIR